MAIPPDLTRDYEHIDTKDLNLEGSLVKLFDEETQQHYAAFNCISYPTSRFKDNIRKLVHNRQFNVKFHTSFIDVGSGTGTTLVAASHYFRRCYGVEIHKIYNDVARLRFGQLGINNIETTQIDAFKFTGYKDASVAFFYRPINDDYFYKKLVHKVFDDLPDNALLIQSYAPIDIPRNNQLKLTGTFDWEVVKKLSAKA